VYAIEIGIGDARKFWQDYHKSITDWASAGVAGVFVLLLQVGDEDGAAWLDGAVLRTPRNHDFAIYPLILPLGDQLNEEMRKSITAVEFFRRHRQELVQRILTISDRDPGEVRRWTSDVMGPAAAELGRILHHELVRSAESTRQTAYMEALDVLVVQTEKPPHLPFSSLVPEERPLIVILADWLDGYAWTTNEDWRCLLPVEIVGKTYSDGQWNCFEQPRLFGRDIRPSERGNLNLAQLTESRYGVLGFVKTSVRRDDIWKDITVDATIRDTDGQTYPFVVSSKSQRVVFVASGVGGWGE